jgi:hypothetical protein
LDEEKSKFPRFGSGKWFWLSITAQFAVAGECAVLCRKECNKYDLTSVQWFLLAHHNDLSRWFAISSPPPPIGCPSFSFLGGVANQ